jgi:hypothetical protein
MIHTPSVFWSLGFRIWNLFVIWILGFGALKCGAWSLGFYNFGE